VPADATTSDLLDDISLSSHGGNTVQTLERNTTLLPTRTDDAKIAQGRTTTRHWSTQDKEENTIETRNNANERAASNDEATTARHLKFSYSSHNVDSDSDSQSSTPACDDFGNAKDISHFYKGKHVETSRNATQEANFSGQNTQPEGVQHNERNSRSTKVILPTLGATHFKSYLPPSIDIKHCFVITLNSTHQN
jgi:hypothetical protein